MKTQSDQSYFKIPINASCPIELDKRIKDNESRGFELVAIYNVENFEHVYLRDEYRGTNTRKGYRAVMQRLQTGGR